MEKIICKTCGGHNEVESLSGSWFCEYCGNPIDLGPDRARFKDLFSKADDAWDRKDFDEALKFYEQIVAQDNTQAEAHWSAAMCRYGVAFVVDPLRGKKMPTCNRINRTSILEDKNYLAAIRHAAPQAKATYEGLAREIDRISARFLKIVDQEAPYDVFISYKKTGDNGRATVDSDYARRLYYFLTDKGLKVFFAEETLMDKAGHMYEPYIFAALTSSKVMVLLGSCREYFEAVWVKNEWKRFLLLAEQDMSKSLVPVCIKCKPEEALPVGLSQMQALDGDDFNLTERVYDIVKRKMGAAPQAKKAGNMNLLAEKYATKENVGRVCDALDCEPDFAAEVLILKQGKVNESISYISSDKAYQKSLWICTECGAKNTHDACHNPNCGISHADSIRLKQMREEAARREAEQKRIAEEERRKAYEKSEEAKRIRKAKKAAARKRFLKVAMVIVLLLAAAAGAVVYINPMQELRVILPEGGVEVSYRDTEEAMSFTVEGNFLIGGWKTVDLSEVTIDGFDSTKLGKHDITVSYKGKTATATVEVMPIDLQQPVLAVKDGEVFAQFGAEYVGQLQVEINGDMLTLEGKNLSNGMASLKLGDEYMAGEYTIRAKAISKDPCVNDSEYSKSITVTKLEQVAILERTGSVITIEESEETTKYDIYIDGKLFTTVEGTTFDLMEVNRVGEHTVAVTAHGTDGNNTVSSAKSGEWYYTVLSNAVNITVTDGLLSWNSIDGAVGYEVYVNGVLYDTFDADATSLNVMRFYDQSGSANIAIRVLGDGEDYLTSPKSEAFVQNYTEVYIPLRNPDDLYQLANSEEKFLLTNDIDLAGIAWTPIEGFTGTLVGNGCAIQNLTIHADTGNIGFFATLGGTVTDLVFENASVTVTGRNENVGILCGTLKGNASDVVTGGTVTAETCTNVGGIAGLVNRGGTYEIADLENEANVTGNENVGGVFGFVNNKTDKSTDYILTLKTLKNTGAIKAEGNYAGGIVGYVYAENTYSSSRNTTLQVNSLVNNGTVNGKQYVGGIFGCGYCDVNTGAMVDCSNVSAITAEAYVGAIAGQLKNIVVNSCSNAGSAITATGYVAVDGEKYAYVGGYVGYGYRINDCTNTVAISYKDGGRYVGGIMGYTYASATYEMKNLENTADISGSDYVGGIFGASDGGSDTSTVHALTLSNMKNTGAITASGSYVGGIAGYVLAENTYSTSKNTLLSVSQLSNTGSITGKQYVGGIFGYGYSDDTGSTITDCINTSVITAETYVGAIAGQLKNIVVNSCSNAGSAITATGYVAVDGEKYAYVGGYVGYGYRINDCTNTVAISYKDGGRYVGGIMGYTYASATYEMKNLENTADISGSDYVGGIFGASDGGSDTSTVHALTLSNMKNTGAITASGSYVGGIAGYVLAENTYSTSKNTLLSVSQLSNTGSITGKQYVGGIFGYGYSDDNRSTITDCINASIVEGEAYVGAIAGQLSHIGINGCSNAGSTITATGYVTADSVKYAYVGGYVGRGYLANNCINTVAITYKGGGRYVGGIMGYTDATGTFEMTKLENQANISGSSYVGGIFGALNSKSNGSSNYTITLSELKNSGKVTASGSYAGGLIGYVYVENTYSSSRNTTFYANKMTNSGNVTANKYAGGLFGYIVTDSANSSVMDVTATGTVSASSNYGKRYGYGENITFE